MIITADDRTVRDIALANPGTIRVFEKYGIDYCCGGKLRLEDVCTAAKIDLEELQRELTATAEQAMPSLETDLTSPLLSHLTRYIVETHHSFVRNELPRLEALLDKVEDKHGESHPEIIRIKELFLEVRAELVPHMIKEEVVLFPYIDSLEAAQAAGTLRPRTFFSSILIPISEMEKEHSLAGDLMAKIRKLTTDYVPPRETCPTFAGLYAGLDDFERDLHRHVHLENNILFPRAIQLEESLQNK